MLFVPESLIPKHELVFLATSKMAVPLATQESGLVQEGILMTPTRVETKQNVVQIMEKNASKPCVTSWCSKKENINKTFNQTDLKPFRM